MLSLCTCSRHHILERKIPPRLEDIYVCLVFTYNNAKNNSTCSYLKLFIVYGSNSYEEEVNVGTLALESNPAEKSMFLYR